MVKWVLCLTYSFNDLHGINFISSQCNKGIKYIKENLREEENNDWSNLWRYYNNVMFSCNRRKEAVETAAYAPLSHRHWEATLQRP